MLTTSATSVIPCFQFRFKSSHTEVLTSQAAKLDSPKISLLEGSVLVIRWTGILTSAHLQRTFLVNFIDLSQSILERDTAVGRMEIKDAYLLAV